MKKLLIGILTILITVALFLLGISLNLKATVVDTMDVIIREEIANNFLEDIEIDESYNKQKIREELAKVMEENETIKKIIDQSYMKIMDILEGKEVESITFEEEIKELINNSEEILKEYNISLSKEEKEELLEIAKSEEVTNEIKNSINEAKEIMPENTKVAINTFNYFRSTTFKIILIVVIILCLGIIALLKKSIYKWLTNLSFPCLLTGLSFGIVLPYAANLIAKELIESNYFVISTTALARYGYNLLFIGTLAIIINIVLVKLDKKKITKENKD